MTRDRYVWVTPLDWLSGSALVLLGDLAKDVIRELACVAVQYQPSGISRN